MSIFPAGQGRHERDRRLVADRQRQTAGTVPGALFVVEYRPVDVDLAGEVFFNRSFSFDDLAACLDRVHVAQQRVHPAAADRGETILMGQHGAEALHIPGPTQTSALMHRQTSWPS